MYIGILGGSFNPVHVGHVRLALEVLESGMGLDRMDLIPCAQPPHKSLRGMLPFDLRLKMLLAAVRDMPALAVNDLEGHRQGPSYTWDTLSAYRTRHPDARLLFVVGGEDFGAISQWHRGPELPRLADIAMVPRAGSAREAFCHEVVRQWPEARLTQDGDSLYATLPGGARLHYLPLPRLDISASFIRQRWLSGGSVHFLLPDAVLDVLRAHRAEVESCWSLEESASLGGEVSLEQTSV